MIGGVAVAGMAEYGAIPVLAPATSEPALVAEAASRPAKGAPPQGPLSAHMIVVAEAPEGAIQMPETYNYMVLPPPRARLGRRGFPARPPATPEAEEAWIDRVIPDGDHYGDTPRLYVFAAGGGQSVGMNYLPYGDGWLRDGWSRDPLAVTGDAQAGVGIRRGPIQVSFGYVYRRTRTEIYETLILPKHEDRVAVTVSIKQ